MKLVKYLEIAIQRNYQLNRFMQNLSNVVKLPPPEKEPIELNESLMVVLDSFSAILKEKNISLETRMDNSSIIISADSSQLEQVFSNIIKNSIESIKSDGQIVVSVKSGPTRIYFEDDGAGFSKETYEKNFYTFLFN